MTAFFDRSNCMTECFLKTDYLDLFDKIFYFLSRPINSPKEMEPQKYIFDGQIILSVSSESLSPFLSDRSGEELTCYRMRMMIFLEDVLAKQAQEIVIFGMSPKPLVITAAEIEPVRSYAEIIRILYDTVTSGRYTPEQAYALLNDREFVFIGSMPQAVNGVIPKGTTFTLSELDREENGRRYRALRLFLTEESARKFGGKGQPLTKDTLENIKRFYGGKVIIEPHRNWWMEF